MEAQKLELSYRVLVDALYRERQGKKHKNIGLIGQHIGQWY